MDSHTTHKFSWGNFILLALSLGLTFAAVEIAYRFRLSQKTLYSYNVVSSAFYGFSKELGYDYLPGTNAVAASIQQNKVVFWREINIGPNRNLDNGASSWSDDVVKIAAFGDSFTSNPFTLYSWSDYAAKAVSDVLGTRAEVMNLGREGTGTLQIVRHAAIRAKEFSPDLIILAMIKDDLTRARFWRTRLTVNGLDRMLTTFDPDSLPPIQRANDIFVMDDALTSDWSKKMMGAHDAADPTLLLLNEHYDRLLGDIHSKSLLTPTHSFLIDRLRFGDPFFSLRKPTAFLPRITLNDYSQDSTFVADAERLRTIGVPLMVVLLPEITDLNANQYVLNDQQRSLLESLERHIGLKVVNCFEYLQGLEGDNRKYFNFPYDYHSSKLGAELYAGAIAQAVKRQFGDRLRKENSVAKMAARQ